MPAALGAPAGVRRPPQARAEIARDRRRARSGNRPARRNAFWRDLDRAVKDAEDGGGALSVARFSFEDLRPPRQHRCRAPVQPAGAQHRFRLPRAGRLDPRRLHRNRPAQRPCGRAPHRQRAQAHHARARSRPRQSSRRSRWRRSSPPTISRPWWRGSAPIPRLPPADARHNLAASFPGGSPPMTQRSRSMWCPTSSARGATSASGGWKRRSRSSPRSRSRCASGPYFLNPWVPREGISREQYLITKFGSVERYNTNNQRVVDAAAAAKGSSTTSTRSSASPTRSIATG